MSYGYFNGKECATKEDWIIANRQVFGFDGKELDNLNDLMELGSKLSDKWRLHGSPAQYSFARYPLEDIKSKLYNKEYQILEKAQKEEYEAWLAKDKEYDYSNYEGRPLTEDEIKLFFKRQLEKCEERNKGFVARQQEELLERWREGEIICVDSDSGSYDDYSLMSNGKILHSHYYD